MNIIQKLVSSVFFVAVFLCVAGSAQMSNDSLGSLVVNGVNGPAPNRVVAFSGSPLTLTIAGNANQPFILAAAPVLSVGDVNYAPGISTDIGPSTSVILIMNGLESPLVNFWNLFANTGPTGSATLSFDLPSGLGNGSVISFQAFVIDFSTPLIVNASAAAEVVLTDPVGELTFHSNVGGAGSNIFSASPGLTALPAPSAGDPFEFLDLALSRFGEFYANEGSVLTAGLVSPPPGDIDRFLQPTPTQPRFFSGTTQKPFVRTTYGDIYHVETMGIGGSSYGFGLAVGSSFEFQNGTFFSSLLSGSSPWKRHINIDQSVLAAVLSGQGLMNDRVFLFHLDGAPFAGSGNSFVEITPAAGAPAIVRAESLTFAGGSIWFTGGPGAISSHLFRAPLDGSSNAIAVTLPSVAAGIPATIVSQDLRASDDGLSFFVRLGASGDSIGRVFRVSGITPATQVFDLVTLFSPSRGTLDFGRTSDGSGNRFSVSPSGVRAATVAMNFGNTSQEIYLTAVGTGVILQVTTVDRFANGIDTVMECLHWDDSNVLFWAGTDESSMDLYNFNRLTLTLLNITQTNGQSGFSLPFHTGTLAKIDPSGQFRRGDYFYFVRRGLSTAGSMTGSYVNNLCGVHLPTLTLFNITGDEFGISGPLNTVDPLPFDSLFVDPISQHLWFAAQTESSSHQDLFTIALELNSPATQVVLPPSLGAASSKLKALCPDRLHTGCYAIQSHATVMSGDAVVRGLISGLGGRVHEELSGDQIRSLLSFPEEAGVDGFWFERREAANPLFSLLDVFFEGPGIRRTVTAPGAMSGLQFLGITLP